MRLALPAVLAVTALTLATSVPASAEGQLGVSPDGSSWSQTLPRPLFPAHVRWVPGDVRTAVFYVRNQADSGAVLSVEVESADSDGLLGEDITLAARAEGGPWQLLENHVESQRLSADRLGVGESFKVELRAALDPHSTNQSQRRQVALVFVVTLRDGRAVGEVPGAVDSGGVPWNSIATELRGGLLLFAVLVGVGLALVRRSRREES